MKKVRKVSAACELFTLRFVYFSLDLLINDYCNLDIIMSVFLVSLDSKF